MNLHPGVETLFRYMNGDELTVAELMVEGDLPSPQVYKNVVLFSIRITGIGVAFRPAHNEWVYREPEDYISERFLKRCNGLPVIWNHPEKTVLLNSEEFADRIVGTVFLPYIKNNEVWAIAKIYDDDTIKLLNDEQLSTSPAVLLHKGSQKYQLKDGTSLLVEDRASLLDHIAICPKGVWDKNGDPTGIEANFTQELAMADESKSEKEKADAAAKADAANFDSMLTGVCDRLDAFAKRMDAWDEKEKEKADAVAKADSEKEEKEKADAAAKADAVKADAEKEEKEKADAMEAERLAADKKKDSEKADAARSDSALIARLDASEKQVADLLKMIQTPLPDADRAGLSEVQSRADRILVMLGDRAKAPVVGESVRQYRNRMANKIQHLSTTWKDAKLDSMDEAVFVNVENQIYADALVSARTPSNIDEGMMREVKSVGPGGHLISDFVGNGAHFVTSFSPRRSMRMIKSVRLNS